MDRNTKIKKKYRVDIRECVNEVSSGVLPIAGEGKYSRSSKFENSFC
jgi:hypothetical protein